MIRVNKDDQGDPERAQVLTITFLADGLFRSISSSGLEARHAGLDLRPAGSGAWGHVEPE